MGKFIFWIVVFFLLLFGLRLASMLSSRRKDEDELDEPSACRRPQLPEGEPTVRCVSCGAFIPKKQAVLRLTGYRCGEDYGCPKHDS